MSKTSSILLGDHFEKFIRQQIELGRFATASEVVRAALSCFEEEENKKFELIKELKKGEKSGTVKNFNKVRSMKKLHTKYVNDDQ